MACAVRPASSSAPSMTCSTSRRGRWPSTSRSCSRRWPRSFAIATRISRGWHAGCAGERMINAQVTFVYEFVEAVRAPDLTLYVARVYGLPRDDGTWEGWLEFSDPKSGVLLRTDRETTQSNFEHLSYWATGLEATYLDGALLRALRR